MSRGRALSAATVLVVALFAGALVVAQRADRRSLQARYAAAASTGTVPEAPPAVSGATLTLQERL